MEAAGGAAALLGEPQEAVRRLVARYHSAHFLSVRVADPVVSGGDEALLLTVPITEGPRARLASVTFEGSSRPAPELREALHLPPGEPYDDEALAAALDRLRAHFFGLGHSRVRLSVRSVPAAPDVALVITLSEGPAVTVGRIVVEAGGRLDADAVRRRVGLAIGQPLDPRALARVERDLAALPGVARAVVVGSDENPSTVTVRVSEADRFVAGYLLNHNTGEGNDLRLDGEVRNLPAQSTLGARFRLATDAREARGFLRLPGLRGLGGDLTVIGSRLDEDLEGTTDGTPGVLENRRRQTEVQLKYGREVPGALRLEAGYRWKRVRVQGVLDAVLDLAGLDASAVRDTRDNPLDARRGHLLSLTAHYAPSALGTDFTFGKMSTQVFAIRGFGPSWTWAQGYRLGVGRGFGGQRIRSSERFFAGGGNTVRGFATDTLGPRDSFGERAPLGGEAFLVLNQELRYRHPSGVGAAVFYDAGEVFARLDDVSLDLRHAAGAGLRWQSPVGLLRLDAGMPLGRRPGEPALELFFSLGQAF